MVKKYAKYFIYLKCYQVPDNIQLQYGLDNTVATNIVINNELKSFTNSSKQPFEVISF